MAYSVESGMALKFPLDRTQYVSVGAVRIGPGRIWPRPAIRIILVGTGETNLISFRITNKPVLRQQQGGIVVRRRRR
jgi:hypothetical protein